MKVVIMAGGKGTRIAAVNADVPKPMIPIKGKPVLEYQVEGLRRQGYRDFIFITGHLSHIISDYFGNGDKVSPCTGMPFGVNIRYIVENEPLGTAGALYYLRDLITDDFLLLNGDVIFDIDVSRFMAYHKKNGGLATIMTHPNDHPYDSGLIETDDNGLVKNWMHKEDYRLWYKNRVNAGIHIISPRLLERFNMAKKCDLDREILQPLIKEKALYAYDSPEYVKDMGTRDRLLAVENDIAAGRVSAKNLFRKQKAVFVDRDGTINKHVGFLKKIDQFELIDGVAEAFREINKLGYLIIVVTNQPVIARGDVSIEELEMIHMKMETLLGQKGAYIDGLYYCPHHPDKGFEGERPEYKVECSCRKPKPGLILQAAAKYNIELKESWMVGDGINDIAAGRNAGCKTAYIGTSEMENTLSYKNMMDFVEDQLR